MTLLQGPNQPPLHAKASQPLKMGADSPRIGRKTWVREGRLQHRQGGRTGAGELAFSPATPLVTGSLFALLGLAF